MNLLPRVGDRVVYESPPVTGAHPAWQRRREHDSLVVSIGFGLAHCLLQQHDDAGRLVDGMQFWSAELRQLRVVGRATYTDLRVLDQGWAAVLRGSTVALDFDGPVHSYRSGWTGYEPTDPPTEGALEFVQSLLGAGARVVIHTSRADSRAGKDGVRAYLRRHGFPALEVTYEKVPAAAYVDDRAVFFREPDRHGVGGYDEVLWAAVLRQCLTRHSGEAHPDERTGEAAALDEAFTGTRGGADLRGLGEVDTESSASVQHFIDTGSYLAHGEAEQAGASE